MNSQWITENAWIFVYLLIEQNPRISVENQMKKVIIFCAQLNSSIAWITRWFESNNKSFKWILLLRFKRQTFNWQLRSLHFSTPNVIKNDVFDYEWRMKIIVNCAPKSNWLCTCINHSISHSNFSIFSTKQNIEYLFSIMCIITLNLLLFLLNDSIVDCFLSSV